MNNNLNSCNKILICDDHALLCLGLKELIKIHLPDTTVEVVNCRKDCEEVLASQNFDVFLCDIKIGEDNGLQLIEDLRNRLQNTRVIIISGMYEDYLLKRARFAGADYFLKKESSLADLLPAIMGDPELKLDVTLEKEEEIPPFLTLTKKESEIIKLIVEGNQSKEIAEKLYISKVTVDTHRRNIHRKLNTTNSSDLLRLVYDGSIAI